MKRGFGRLTVHQDTAAFFAAAGGGGTGAYSRQRQIAYANGDALQRHTKYAHGGVFAESCRACQELKAKLA